MPEPDNIVIDMCSAILEGAPTAEKEALAEKLEDCLDLLATLKSLKEANETGEITPWEDFEKELDEIERAD
jgi:hypothetical protein